MKKFLFVSCQKRIFTKQGNCHPEDKKAFSPTVCRIFLEQTNCRFRFNTTNLICNLTKLFLLCFWDIFQQFPFRVVFSAFHVSDQFLSLFLVFQQKKEPTTNFLTFHTCSCTIADNKKNFLLLLFLRKSWNNNEMGNERRTQICCRNLFVWSLFVDVLYSAIQFIYYALLFPLLA